MYKDKDAVLPLPQVLENIIGLNEKEKASMMDLIVETSGRLLEWFPRLFQLATAENSFYRVFEK